MMFSNFSPSTVAALALVAAAAVFTCGFGLGVATRTAAGIARLLALSCLVAFGVLVVMRYLPG